MLSPKRTKYRKQQKGKNRGLSWTGCDVSFGDFGMMAVEHGRLTSRQIEAGRMAITRKVKRQLMTERFKQLVEAMYDDREERLIAAGTGGVLAD